MPDNYLLGHERVKIDESVPKMPSLGHGQYQKLASVPKTPSSGHGARLLSGSRRVAPLPYCLLMNAKHK